MPNFEDKVRTSSLVKPKKRATLRGVIIEYSMKLFIADCDSTRFIDIFAVPAHPEVVVAVVDVDAHGITVRNRPMPCRG